MSPFIRPRSVHRGDRILALAVFLFALALYTATFTGLPENPDAEVEFQTVRSLFHHRSLALGGTPEAELIVERRFDVREGAGDRAGKFYSWFGVGQALVAVPFYAAGHALADLLPAIEEQHARAAHYGVHRSEYFAHLLVGWRNPLLGALTAWLVVLASRRVGASRRSAFFAGLGYAGCTFAWPQARSTLSDVQATFLLFAAFDLILRLRESLERYQRPRWAHLLGFGLALGLAFLTRVVTAPAIAVLVAMFAAVFWRRALGTWPRARSALIAGAPAIACVALFLVLNVRRFGDPLESGYGDAVQLDGSFFAYPWLQGLGGLLVAPGKGLVWLAPGVVFVLVGLPRLLRNGDGLATWGGLAFCVAIFAPITVAESWHGAWTFGPRYVLPALPVLWLAVAHGMDAMSRRRFGRSAVGAVFAFGFVANLGGALVDHMTHQDLALQTLAAEGWPPESPGLSEAQRANQRFDSIQREWRLAAPWAHWRILRHRAAGLGEEFPMKQVFFSRLEGTVTPAPEVPRGFGHLAWVDLHQRLGGSVWPGILLCLVLGVLGLAQTIRGFDPTLR